MKYTRELILIYITLGNIAVSMSLKMKRIVFQSYSLSEGETVQCYGRCNLQGSPLTLKSNVTYCEGRRIRFKCDSNNVIHIQVARKGQLSPDFDICNYKPRMDCAEDISTRLQNTCGGQKRCVFDATNETNTKVCGKIKYLAIDIKYLCKPPAISTKSAVTTKSPNTIKSAITLMPVIIPKKKSTPSIPSKLPVTTQTRTLNKHTIKIIAGPTQKTRLKKTTSKQPVTRALSSTKLVPTTHDINAIAVNTAQNDDGMFWAMTAYTTITNSEFIRKNKTHLALALLLSMFVGMVLCLCFFLDHCRRAIKRKSKQIYENNMGLVQEIRPLDCMDDIELMRPRMVEVMSMNGSLPRHKVLSCVDDGCVNNNNRHHHQLDDECDIYSDSAPFFKRSLEHKSLIHNHNHLHSMQDRSFSPTSLPAPPNHFLIDSSSSSSNDLVPPPDEYSEDNDVTHSTIRASTPSGSINKTPSPQKSVQRNLSNDVDDGDGELVEVEEVYLTEQDLADNLEVPYEYVEVAPYHASDEYSSSPQVPRSLIYHRTDNYVVGPKAKYAPTTRRTTSNDETSQEESMIRTIDSKRNRKNNTKDKPSLQKSKSLDEPKRKYFTLNSHHLIKNPRKGRIHVMQRCTDSLPRRGYNQNAIYSDNEASRRRRQYDTENSCNCQTSHTKESPIKCCSSLTSNGHSSHDGDNQGPLLSISNELIKNKQCCVEESGYQSHDTGTDSLCSSSFSTDHEDSRMFLPSSNGRTCDCRSKSCRIRGHTSKRDPRFVIVRDNNKCRRVRHDEYTDTHGHIHSTNRTSHDVHTSHDVRRPYDSSMDDASSRDSVKLFRKIRKNMTDCNQSDSMKCNCMHDLKPPDNRIRRDGMETS